MPIPLIVQGMQEGISSIPYAWTFLRIAPWVMALVALKYYFGGARNTSERLMRSKVVMVTGGTSGIGAAVVHDLAARGAQVILLTQQPPSDVFLVEYIDDLRRSTGNQLIYAEQVDLADLHSIRTFATKWIDNVPPRRLDMVILCGGTAVPSHARGQPTADGLHQEWQVNYLANFHLLSILSPALRVQPAHRDVRVIFTTCASYIGAKFELEAVAARGGATTTTTKHTTNKNNAKPVKSTSPARSVYALSKLALMIFAHSFQRHLNAYVRPDSLPPCTRVLVVDPGLTRTPGMRRWLTGGSLWGLLVYLLTWPLWWLVLKSPQQGAQSVLYAAMEERYSRGEGAWLVKECRQVDYARTDVRDEQLGKRLWEFSEKQIEQAEKEGAVRRALAKKEKEKEQNQSQNQKQAEEKMPFSQETASGKSQAAGSRRSRRNQNKS